MIERREQKAREGERENRKQFQSPSRCLLSPNFSRSELFFVPLHFQFFFEGPPIQERKNEKGNLCHRQRRLQPPCASPCRYTSTPSQHRGRRREKRARRGALSCAFSFFVSPRWHSLNAFFFFLLSLSLSPSFSKQPLSSKTAERFELDLEAGSIVADLYDAAEKRLGE